jgi:outer membrane protein W
MRTMNMAKRFGWLLVALPLVIPSRAAAQDWLWSVTYGPTVPSGQTKDFINTSTAWRNIGLEGRKIMSENTTVGLAFGWNVFATKTGELISFRQIDISGEQFRYVNSFPLLLTGHYYFGQPDGIRPYVGGGVGAYYAEERLEIGLTALTADAWHFGLAPEAGLIVPIGWRARAMLQARYNWALKANEIEHTYWGFNVGFVFR